MEEGSCFDFFVQSAAGQIYTNVLMACTSIGHHPIIATSTVWSKFSTSLRCIITRVGDKTTAFSKLLTYIDQNVMNMNTSVLHPKDTKLAMTQKPRFGEIKKFKQQKAILLSSGGTIRQFLLVFDLRENKAEADLSPMIWLDRN